MKYSSHFRNSIKTNKIDIYYFLRKWITAFDKIGLFKLQV